MSKCEQKISRGHGGSERKPSEIPFSGSWRRCELTAIPQHWYSQAEQAYLEALAIKKDFARQYATIPDNQNDLAAIYNNLGMFYAATGRPKETEQANRDALDLYKALTGKHPATTEYALGLGATQTNIGKQMRESGQAEASLTWYAQSLATLHAVLAKQQQHAAARAYLVNAYEGRAEALTRLGRHADALQDWDRAVELANGNKRPLLCIQRAATQARPGKHAGALAEAKTLAEAKNATCGILYHAAGVYALSARAVLYETQLRESEKSRLVEGYAGQALVLLSRAREAGHFREAARSEALKKDADFEPLLSRADFQKFLASLEKK
jgi:tetratricopeptide (TPR) repeat protein